MDFYESIDQAYRVDQLYYALKDAELEAWVVGGAIRNALVGLLTKDIDIALVNSPEEILAKLPGAHMINSAQAYPIVSYLGFELASFRSDGVNRQDANGIKLGATMREDAMRRDFTMNALYFPFNQYALEMGNSVRWNKSSIIDPTGQGVEDITNKVIRLIGQPRDRLMEDPLRALRAYRFQTQLNGFTIEPESKQAIATVLNEVRMK